MSIHKFRTTSPRPNCDARSGSNPGRHPQLRQKPLNSVWFAMEKAAIWSALPWIVKDPHNLRA